MFKFLSKLWNAIILIICILCLGILLPGFAGINSYNVISASMEPGISVGSLVYVQSVPFGELEKNDIIAFFAGDSVVTHRIVEINTGSQLITTKGDANSSNDMNPVAYGNVIGEVKFHLPLYGYFAEYVSNPLGKLCVIMLVVVAAVLSLIAKKLENYQPKPDGPFDTGVEIKRKKPRKRKGSAVVVLVIGIIFIAGAAGGLFYIVSDYKGSNDLYDEVKATYVKDVESSESDKFIEVDFEGLKAVNPDVIGWIYVEETDISYPIMYSGDDEKYLHTGVDGKYAKAGSIFLEGANNTDFSDYHSIIYGHNMRNGSMFGSLKKYKSDKAYIKEGHQYFQLLLADGTKLRYQIFSYFDTQADDWVYAVPYSEGAEYEEYIAKLKASSYQDMSVDVNSDDKVVTLSTCSVEDMRFVINGVLIEKVE